MTRSSWDEAAAILQGSVESDVLGGSSVYVQGSSRSGWQWQIVPIGLAPKGKRTNVARSSPYRPLIGALAMCQATGASHPTSPTHDPLGMLLLRLRSFYPWQIRFGSRSGWSLAASPNGTLRTKMQDVETATKLLELVEKLTLSLESGADHGTSGPH